MVNSFRSRAGIILFAVLIFFGLTPVTTSSAAPSAPRVETSAMDVEALSSVAGYAGAWIDASGRTHVNAKRSSPAALARLQSQLTLSTVTYDLHELDSIHARATAALAAARLADRTSVRVDMARNAVRIGVVRTVLAPARAAVAGIRGVLVETDATAAARPSPSACTDRLNCGAPIRGGVQTFSQWYALQCSVGFSAHASDGSRWMMTAGHCAGGADGNQPWLNEPFQHGQQPYGPTRQRYNPFTNGQWFDTIVNRWVWLDFLRARLDNAYWLQLPGGYLYATATSTVDVKPALATEALAAGQTICRSSWSPFHDDAAPNCGTVVTFNGPRNEIEVTGMVNCHGDSGGSVYVPTSTGRRAVGFISGFYFQGGTNPDCVQPGYTSLIGSLSSAYHFMDINSAATIRVDTR